MDIHPMATRKKKLSLFKITSISLIIITISFISSYSLFYFWAKRDDKMMCQVLGYQYSITEIGIPTKGYCVNDFDGGNVLIPVEDAYKNRIKWILLKKMITRTLK